MIYPNEAFYVISGFSPRTNGDFNGAFNFYIGLKSNFAIKCLDKELTNFSKLVGDIYQIGYLKAVDDYKDQLKKHNINVKISQQNLVDNV